MRSRVISVVLLIILSLTIKLTIWYSVSSTAPEKYFLNDALRYHSAARAILQLHRYVESPEHPEDAQLRVPPGYPAFLSAIYRLFGVSPAIGVLANILLSVVTLLLLSRVSSERFGGDVAVVAIFLLTFDLASLSYALQLMSETLFTVCVMLVLVAGCSFIRSTRSTFFVALTSVALAGATLIRSISYYLLLPVVLMLLVLAVRERWNIKQTATLLMAATVPFVVIVGSWQVRNHIQLGTWQFTDVDGYNMYYYRAATIIALRDDVSLNAAREQLDRALDSYEQNHLQSGSTEAKRGEVWMAQGLAIVSRYPLLFMRSLASGVISLMLAGGDGPILRMLDVPVGTIGDYKTFDALAHLRFSAVFERFAGRVSVATFVYAMLYLGVLYAGIVSWAIRGAANRDITTMDVFIWIVVLYVVLVSAGAEAGSRFRVPIMPVLSMYAAKGWLGAWKRVQPVKGAQNVRL